MPQRTELEKTLRKYILKLNSLREEPYELDIENVSFYELWEVYSTILGVPRNYFDLYVQACIDKNFSRNQILDYSEVHDYLYENDVFDPNSVCMGIQDILYDEKHNLKIYIQNLEESLKKLEEKTHSSNPFEQSEAINDFAYDERNTKNEIYVENGKVNAITNWLNSIKNIHEKFCEDNLMGRK